jgi:nucleoside-diphosphate-sugar epimerase
MKKVFVTGATGFVGSHLVELLTNEGHEVYSLIRSDKKAKEFNVAGNYIKGSLNPNDKLEWIDELPKDLDIVIHTAGIVHASDTSIFDDINTLATNNLLEQLKSNYNNLHFIFISSLAAGGPSLDVLRDEQMQDMPVSHYGKSKKAAEEYLEQSIPTSWNYSCIRPPMVIGPRDPAVLDIFKMVKGSIVVGPGLNFKEKEYSFICVFDLVNSISKVIETSSQGTFYISHDEKVSFFNLIEEIKKQANKNKLLFIPIPNPLLKFVAHVSSLLPIPSRLTKDKVNELIQNNWTCSNIKLKTEVNYTPEWDLKRTISITLEDYKKRNWL